MFEFSSDEDFGEDINLESFGPNNEEPPQTPKVHTPPAAPTVKTMPKKQHAQKRKFPGPAGLVSPAKPKFDNGEPEPSQNNVIACTQDQIEFESIEWIEMLNTYRDLVKKYTIAWVKAEASLNQLLNDKTPFLAARIQLLEYENERIATVVLKDTTGVIEGIISSGLYKEHVKDLTSGAVIVLRNCGVLFTCKKNTYLTITPNNLVSIYCNNANKTVRVVKRLDFNLNNPKLHIEVAQDAGTSNSTIQNFIEVDQKSVLEDTLSGIDFDELFSDF